MKPKLPFSVTFLQEPSGVSRLLIVVDGLAMISEEEFLKVYTQAVKDLSESEKNLTVSGVNLSIFKSNKDKASFSETSFNVDLTRNSSKKLTSSLFDNYRQECHKFYVASFFEISFVN